MGVDSQTYSFANGPHYLSTGITGTGTYNLSSSLALDGSVSFLPQFQYTNFPDAGRELTAFGGPKMGRRGRRLSLFGKIEPGFASFSCGLSFFGTDGKSYQNCTRRTHFALQYGGVAEYKLSPRTILRADASQTLITEFDQILSRQVVGPGVTLLGIDPGHVAQHFDLRFALEHRFGTLREPEQGVTPAATTVDAGILFALHLKEHLLLNNVEPDKGVGAWASWNFSQHVSWDTSAFYVPHNDGTINFQDGGHSVVAVSGIKAGIRRDRVGLFAKVRPGVIVFSNTLNSINDEPTLTATHSKFADLALDTGGVVEVYPSQRFILRTDVGEATIFYRAKNVLANGQPMNVSAETRSSALLLFGAGFRF